MNIRQGFVSNSSSSSFVILGAKVPNLKIDRDKMIELMDKHKIEYDEKYVEGHFWDNLHSEEFGFYYDGEANIIGDLIASWSDDSGIQTIGVSAEDIVKRSEKIKVIVKEAFGIDIDVKLLAGTSYN